MQTVSLGGLFAGIGGLEDGFGAGLRATGTPAVTRWQAESSPYARAVLARHFPGARLYEDVRHVTRRTPRVTAVLGGSPCQGISKDGLRRGLSDERSGLWREQLRITDELAPELLVWENVAGALCTGRPSHAGGPRTAAALGTVLGDLDGIGYDAAWLELSAEEVGASHLRRRVFVWAWPRRPQLVLAPEGGEAARDLCLRGCFTALPGQRPPPGEPPRGTALALRGPYHMERIEALGNAVVRQCGYVVGVVGAYLLAWRGRGPVDAPRGRSLPEEVARRDAAAMLDLVTGEGDRRRFASVDEAAHRPITLPARGADRGRPEDAPEGRAPGRKGAACGVGCEEPTPPKLWPTLRASDWRSGSVSAKTLEKNSRPLCEIAAPGGYLTPAWAERHMGFDEGWTWVDPALAPPPQPRGRRR